jgi:hypothetical protein
LYYWQKALVFTVKRLHNSTAQRLVIHRPIWPWNAIGHANRRRFRGSFPYDSPSAGQAPDGDALGARAGVVG